MVIAVVVEALMQTFLGGDGDSGGTSSGGGDCAGVGGDNKGRSN